jgi:hypothetical protein
VVFQYLLALFEESFLIEELKGNFVQVYFLFIILLKIIYHLFVYVLLHKVNVNDDHLFYLINENDLLDELKQVSY